MSDSIKELFVSIYGGPIYFTMKACTEKKELQQLISCWGGEMTETTGPHTIHLVSQGEEAPKTGDSFHVQYIYDCIDKERLLLIDKYRVNKNSCYVGNMTAMWVMLGKSSWPDCHLKRNDGMVNEVTLSQEIYETRAPDPPVRNNPGPSVRNNPGPSVRNNPGPSVRNNSGPSVRNDPGPSARNDPGLSVRNDPGPSVGNNPGPSSWNNSSTRKKKKVAYYSYKERTAILDYISKTKRFKDIKGRVLWQDMAEAQICPGRTWQSLKEHFLKRIIPNLRHTEPFDKVTKQIYFPYTDCNTRENADIIHGSETSSEDKGIEKNKGEKNVEGRTGREVERQNHAVEENSILPKTNTGVSHMEEEERQEPHVEISPGRQNCLDSSEPFSVNLPIFIQGTGRCEDAMSEGFQPLDVDNEEDVSTDMFIETDSEGEKMEQFDLEQESADSSVDVCEETQASELQDHTQRAPKNDEVQTFIPETEDLDNVENLEDVSTSRNNELEMEENCKSISSQETNCDIIDGMQNTLSEDKLFNTGSLVEGVIPNANFNQKVLTDSESSCESGSSSCFSGSFSFVIKDEQNLKNHMRSNEKDAPIQKDSSDVDTSPEERKISCMAAGQPKTKHRSIRYTKRALREQYSTSPEEKNCMHRKRFQPLKNRKGSRFACDMSSLQREIVIQRPIPTKSYRNHVLQGALSVEPTRTTKRAASPEKRKKLTNLYDTYDSDNIESEDNHSVLSEDDFTTSENDEEIPQKGDQNASLPVKALYRDSFTGRFDRLYNPTTGCKLGDKRRSVNTIRKIRRYEPYSVKEDLVIIKYIEKHKLQAAAGGIEMWQNMERAGILQNRTMQGMKERYIKRILPHIHTYLQLGLSEKTVKTFQHSTSRRQKASRSNEVGGRRPYSFREDSLIVHFILKNKRFSEVGGKAMWVTMASTVPGLNRSWQSLKEHYRKYTVNHLQDFQLTNKELAMFKTSGASERRNGKHFTRMIKSNLKRDEETSSNDFTEDNSSEPDCKKRKSANERKRQKHTDEEIESHNEEKINRKSKKGEKRSRDNLRKPSRTDHIQSPQVNQRRYVAKRKLFKFGEVAKLTPQAPFVRNGVGNAIIQRKFLGRRIYSSSEEEQQKCA